MDQDGTKEQLKKAYRRLLNPLVRILVRNGVTATEACELMKQVYVDAATAKEFHLERRRHSDTRISILTGLTRKEVHRLRHGKTEENDQSNLSRVSRVIAGWNQDPRFTGPYGLPLSLPFDGSDDDGANFTDLVRLHSGDMAPRAMLDELLRVGLAVVDDEGLVRNTGRTYIPSQLDPASIQRIGQVVGSLADTLDHNTQVTGDEEEIDGSRFERNVSTDIGLTEEEYQEFKVFVGKKCQQLLETLDNWLATNEGRVTPKKRRHLTKLIRTGVGIFHFRSFDLQYTGKKSDSAP